MSHSEREPLPDFHPAHWAAITDQRHRMMDVWSVLACTQCALLNAPEIDVHGAVAVAHDILDDIIEQLDIASLDTATKKWFSDRGTPAKDD